MPPEGPDPPQSPSPETQEPRAPVSRPARKKPRYLVFALVMTLLFGAMGWADGCEKLAFYRGETDNAVARSWAVQNDADRARADAKYQRYAEAADAGHGRMVPLAAATFVLGAALLALASRAFAGSMNARGVLLQLLVAQGVVATLVFILSKDVWKAEWAWIWELVRISQHESLPPDAWEQSDGMVRALEVVFAPACFAARLVAIALVIVALTRQKSREFFEAAGNAVSER